MTHAVPRSFAALVLVGALASCHSSARTAPTAPPRPSTPKLAVVLVDAGLQVSAHRLPAADYVISFEDRRSNRKPSQRVELQFGASGPQFAFITVPAGGHVRGALWANTIPWVVVDGVRSFPRVVGGFDIATSKQYPTPAT